jgi:hypothetical protein
VARKKNELEVILHETALQSTINCDAAAESVQDIGRVMNVPGCSQRVRGDRRRGDARHI